MKKTYLKEKAELLNRNKAYDIVLFTNELVRSLPEPIKKFLKVCGYMNTPVPINANVKWKECYFRMSPKKDWGKIQTLQVNSIQPIARVAYMKFSSLPISARDIYTDGYGEMKVKLFNLFRIAFDNSKETAQSALITSFAEFLIIPGYFVLENIEWETVNKTTVRATLTDSGIVVIGLFYFNKDGLLYKFETEDRYYSLGKNKYKKIKYSGIVDSYKEQGGLRIAENVRVMWHLPEGDFEYFKGTIEELEFNINE
jgi:hypothetical protein